MLVVPEYTLNSTSKLLDGNKSMSKRLGEKLYNSIWILFSSDTSNFSIYLNFPLVQEEYILYSLLNSNCQTLFSV